jgi:hypothetical protein
LSAQKCIIIEEIYILCVFVAESRKLFAMQVSITISEMINYAFAVIVIKLSYVF